MTEFLARLAGYSDNLAADLGRFAGGGPGGADSREFAATTPINILKSIFRRGPTVNIHFASEEKLAQRKADFFGSVLSGDRPSIQRAGFTLHAIEDVHGAHKGLNQIGHFLAGHKPDRIIGDQKFINVSNEVFQVLTGDSTATLTTAQVNDLIDAIVARCGQEQPKTKLEIIRQRGGSGESGVRIGGGGGPFRNWTSLDILRLIYGVDSIGVGSYPKIRF
jgi:hypothetical protein